jgi:hypothetical protein
MRISTGLLAGLTAAVLYSSGPRVIDFDHDAVGVLPSEWESAMTKTGAGPQWQVVEDQTAPSRPHVLGQLSTDRTAGRFPLAVLRGVSIRDGEVGVRFKPIAGEVDQAAGVVWRVHRSQ